MSIVVALDHGNRMMKTQRHVFHSSYMEGSSIAGGNVLKYNSKVYTLVDEILPVLNDKTEDERYFILSLFAIGMETENEATLFRKLTPHDPIKVELLIGLPLQHYDTMKSKFEQYFSGRTDNIQFELNGKPYNIRIIKAIASPQAYAATITEYSQLKDSRIVNVVDVGGVTVDCLQLNKFKPNMALCTSLYWGMNTFSSNRAASVQTLLYLTLTFKL